jgi:Tol biopolymer transport system component
VARLILLAALVTGFIIAVPSGAQVGNGKIAYTIGSLGNPREGDGLYTVNADGSNRALLKSGNGFYSPRWSPDGSRVAFTDYYWDGSWPHYRLLSMDADGSNERVVAAGIGSIALSAQPWAPDGSRIAWGPFPASGGDIYTADAGGGDVRQLTFDGASDVKDSPAWSPTGSTLVYSRRLDGVYRLFVVGADGSGPTQITSGDSPQDDRVPTWAPSGDSIAFTRSYAVYVIHPDGTGARQVSGDDGGVVLAPPMWSPDGTKLVYSTITECGRTCYRSGIWAVDADGRNLRRLTEFGSSTPVWSPDGDRILFLGAGLTTMNPDGTCQVRINEDDVKNDPTVLPASWQPVPGGPSAGRVHCNAISVDTESVTNKPAAVLINAAVVNEGTEPLTQVTLVASAPSNLSPAIAHLQGAGCAIRRQQVTCLLSRLEPGARHSFSLRFDARRVPLGLGGDEAGHRIGLNASAAEQLLPTRREPAELEFSIARCTNRDQGAGTIYGTRAAEKICGRKGVDLIVPGTGSDFVQAGGGNDVINAVDSRSYTDRISCGRGRDRVIANRRDRVSPDCERVIRRRAHS